MVNFRQEKIEGIIVAHLSGRIDIIAAEEIDTEINMLISNGEKYFILDLQDVTYFSSSGVRMIITAKNKLDEIGGSLYLTGVNSTAEKIMTTLGLMGKFRIFTTYEDAVFAMQK